MTRDELVQQAKELTELRVKRRHQGESQASDGDITFLTVALLNVVNHLVETAPKKK